jgi:hypothetical protein
VKEAICAAVPVIYMPLFAEQTHNAVLAKRMGFAESLDKLTLNETNMLATVETVLEDGKYKRNAEKMREIYLDRPIPSLNEGVFWINRLMKIVDRRPTFKRRGTHLSTFQSFFVPESIFIGIAIYFLIS